MELISIQVNTTKFLKKFKLDHLSNATIKHGRVNVNKIQENILFHILNNFKKNREMQAFIMWELAYICLYKISPHKIPKKSIKKFKSSQHNTYIVKARDKKGQILRIHVHHISYFSIISRKINILTL